MNNGQRIRRRRSGPRSARGQGLVLSVAVFALLVATAIGLVYFLSDIGLSTFYMEKLSFIANQIATYESVLPAGTDFSADATSLAQQFVSAMKLPIRDLRVQTGWSAQRPYVQVGGNCSLLVGSFLPMSLKMAATVTVAQATPGFDGWISNDRISTLYAPYVNQLPANASVIPTYPCRTPEGATVAGIRIFSPGR